MYFAGLDIGSTMTKAVIVDADNQIQSVIKGPTGPEHRRLANEVMQNALTQARLELDTIAYIISTGYGRVNVPFADRQITELTCHTRGITSQFPGVKTAIDIGGQDAKCMKINGGKMVDFAMNDKCAAGTGRFLESTGRRLDVEIGRVGDVALAATAEATLSSTCRMVRPEASTFWA